MDPLATALQPAPTGSPAAHTLTSTPKSLAPAELSVRPEGNVLNSTLEGHGLGKCPQAGEQIRLGRAGVRENELVRQAL